MAPPKHQLEMPAFLETVPRADAQVQHINQGRVWRIVGKENVEQTQKASISSGVRHAIVEVRDRRTKDGRYVVRERWAEEVAR